MATYTVAKELPITRTAGTTFDILIHIPVEFDMDLATLARFQVRGPGGNLVLDKTTADNGILITGQDVYMKFEPEESFRKAGGRWELEVTADGDTHVLGKGPFTLETKLIPPA